jgi:hypothetical protein
MGRLLSLDLSDELFALLQRNAETAGVSPEQLASDAIERLLATTATDNQSAGAGAARGRFESHFGEFALDGPSGSDNESIDADLAREYADVHEDH